MNLKFLADLGERVAATYAQAFVGLMLADSTHMLSLGAVKAAAIAGLPAALAVLKAALAGSVFAPGSASLLPAKTDAQVPVATATVAAPEVVNQSMGA